MRFNAKHTLLFCLSFFLVVAMVQGCFAQTFSSSITGTVTDPSGSVIQGAKVRLLNMNTHDTREAVSTTAGTYKFDNLLPGTYEITAEAAGFKAFVQSNMILPATTAATVNIALTVGAVQEQVQVTAEAVLLDTQSATNTATLDTHLIASLPNSYRNPLNFVFALAGTTEAQSGMTTRSGSLDQNGSMFGLNGGRSGNAQILIDGASSTAVDWGGLFVAPNNDAVQEQQIVQNVYDAQYQRSGSGVVTLVTKGGGQKFHGTVYDYFRNSALDANSWFNNHRATDGVWDPIAKGLFHRNQFGATVSGPISEKHHLFFFAAYEGLRQPGSATPNVLTVPTDAERGGDFSHSYNPPDEANPNGTLQVIYNPFSTRLVTFNGQTYYTRDPFPGNVIPSNLFNSVGQRLVNLYPQANRPSEAVNTLNNFFKQSGDLVKNDKIDWRVDWEQNAKNRVFARMSERIRQNDNPDCVLCNGADNAVDQNNRGYQVVLNDTYTPSNTWVIDAYTAYGRWHESQNRTGYGQGDLNALGFDPSLSQAPMLPQTSASGYSDLGAGWSNYNNYIRSNVTFQGNITKQFTRHTLKFGANYDIAFLNIRQDLPIRLYFGRGFTACDPDPNGGPCHASLGSTTGNAIASMLLGTGNGQADLRMDPAMGLHTIGAYIEDQWRVNNRLTVTAGLRYENQRPATERFNRLTYFNPAAVNPINTAVNADGTAVNVALGRTVNGAFEYASSSNRFAWEPENRDFAPRLGIAYKVTDKLVARAGAGLFFSPASAMIGYDSPGQFLGFTSTTSWQGSVDGLGYVPSNLVDNAFPNGLVPPVGNGQGGLTFVGTNTGNVQMWPKGTHRIGYTEQWSADLQYQLTSHSVLEVGYMGTRGRHLMYGNPDINANQLPTQYLALGRNALNALVPNPFYGVITDGPLSGPEVPYNQLLRPFPEFLYLNYTRSLPGASSAYDALKVKFTKQFSNGLSVISSYAWSKALDNGSEDYIGWALGGLWRDSTNTKLDYAISMHDVPQSFATAFVYQLPFGHGKQFGGSAPAAVNHILGNWEISGVVRISSGLPLFAPFYWDNYLNNGDLLGNFGFPGYAWGDLVGNPKPAHQTIDSWINAGAFAPANSSGSDVLRLGNEPSRMTQLREAATKNLDLGVAKTFGGERLKARFGAEFLNFFNHPTYGGAWWGGWGSNIDLCVNCGTFGIVKGTRNDPRNIQLSMKLMF